MGRSGVKITFLERGPGAGRAPAATQRDGQGTHCGERAGRWTHGYGGVCAWHGVCARGVCAHGVYVRGSAACVGDIVH